MSPRARDDLRPLVVVRGYRDLSRHDIAQSAQSALSAHSQDSSLREKSNAFTVWVNSPNETKSTPTSERPLSRSTVILPDASVLGAARDQRGRPPSSRRCPWLSSMMRSGPRPRRPRVPRRGVRVSTSILNRAPQRARAFSTAALTPPEASTWLSLMSTMSKSPMRWLLPPPERTAYFWRVRSPGISLSRVEHDRLRARFARGGLARLRRDARKVRDKVERGAFPPRVSR